MYKRNNFEFLEAGDTLADSLRYQVEQSQKFRKKKHFDFEGFFKAVVAANKSKVGVKINELF